MVVKRTVYQRKVDVDMLYAVKSVLTDVSSFSPSSEQLRENSCSSGNSNSSDEGLMLETSANTLFMA